MSVVISPQIKLAAYGVAALCTAALAVHFGLSLPDAIERAREGVRRTDEAPCQVLRPAPWNPVLGKLPVKAPEFSLPDHSGQQVSLASLRGRVVLVNFWATWCGTCEVEMPSMERLAREMRARNKPFSLLAVSVDESWDPVRKFFAEGTQMTVLLDKDKKIPAGYGTEKFPESFLIDAEGNIRYYIISERRIWESKEVRECIEALME